MGVLLLDLEVGYGGLDLGGRPTARIHSETAAVVWSMSTSEPRALAAKGVRYSQSRTSKRCRDVAIAAGEKTGDDDGASDDNDDDALDSERSDVETGSGHARVSRSGK